MVKSPSCVSGRGPDGAPTSCAHPGVFLDGRHANSSTRDRARVCSRARRRGQVDHSSRRPGAPRGDVPEVGLQLVHGSRQDGVLAAVRPDVGIADESRRRRVGLERRDALLAIPRDPANDEATTSSARSRSRSPTPTAPRSTRRRSYRSDRPCATSCRRRTRKCCSACRSRTRGSRGPSTTSCSIRCCRGCPATPR